MSGHVYAPPIDQLLTSGELKPGKRDWVNYVETLGLTSEHIPELIRMATDADLNLEDQTSLAVWAPIHAMRALGQLEAEAAVEPLLSLLTKFIDDDWIRETLPEVFAQIGAPAIPYLIEYLADTSQGLFDRVCASTALEKMPEQHPETREACVEALTQQLQRFNRNSLELNGFLIAALLTLQAVEALPVIEKAYAARRVDLSITGDLADAQVELGLKSRDELPARSRYNPLLTRMTGSVDFSATAIPYEPPAGFGQSAKSGSTQKKKKT